MHKIFKRFLASALLACFPLVFAACGGGGESVEMTTISGTAVKGPVKGALVQVFTLTKEGTKGELLGSGISDGSAKYSIQIPKVKAVPPLVVTVSGQSGATYTSETTGADVPFTAAEQFNAVLDTFDATKSFTVSPLTDAAYQQVQKFLTKSPASLADARIVSAANARIATLFNVSDVLADPATDLSYSAALKIIDQMVVTAGTGTTLQTMNLINQAFVDVQSTAFRNYQTALVTAANTVKTNDPSLALVVSAIAATTAAPPTEPDWTDTTAPNAVKNLNAVPGSEATTSSVALSWSPATTTGKNPVTGYDIYRDGKKIVSVTSTSSVDKLLALTTSYTYCVVAFDAAGNRALPSAEITVVTPAAPNLSITVGGQLSSNITTLPFKDINPPSVPLNLSASSTVIDATTSSVNLAWSAATDNVAVTGYDVYRDTVKIGTTYLASFIVPSTTSAVAHSYAVIAFDAAGNRSAASTALSFSPLTSNLNITVGGQLTTDTTNQAFKDVTAPTAPTNLVASTTAITASISSVALSWSAASDNVAVTGYDVYRGTAKVGTTAVASYTDPSVTSGAASIYTIIAFDAAGNRSVASGALSVTPVAPNLGVNVGGQVTP